MHMQTLEQTGRARRTLGRASRWTVALALAVCAAATGTAVAQDEVWLRNGDRVSGSIERLQGGELQIQPAWGERATIRWADVVGVRLERPLPMVLEDETRVTGTLGRDDAAEHAVVRSDLLTERIRLEHIQAINPPKRPPIRFSGLFQLGATVTDGNTRTREVSAQGQVTARADRMRLLLRGAWNYGESRTRPAAGIIRRNVQGEIKVDFFVSERLYLFAGMLALGDQFQDLRLRFVTSAGLGYQWFDTGTFSVSTDIGLAYIFEDRLAGVDDDYVAAKVGWKVDWVIVEDRIALFHNAEVLPSLEDSKDILLATQTGLRFTIVGGFFAALQADARYDRSPSPGFRRTDVVYTASVGYSF